MARTAREYWQARKQSDAQRTARKQSDAAAYRVWLAAQPIEYQLALSNRIALARAEYVRAAHPICDTRGDW